MNTDDLNKNEIPKLKFDTITLDTFREFIDSRDIFNTKEFLGFMKYLSFYLNEDCLKDYVYENCQSEDPELFWNQLSINIPKDYWESLVDGEYIAIFVYITKENIQIICDST